MCILSMAYALSEQQMPFFHADREAMHITFQLIRYDILIIYPRIR